MKLRFSAHAVRQLAQRDIDRSWVEAAILSPDWISPDPDPTLGRSFKAINAFGGRVLRVVHRTMESETLIVTAHFDRGAKP